MLDEWLANIMKVW